MALGSCLNSPVSIINPVKSDDSVMAISRPDNDVLEMIRRSNLEKSDFNYGSIIGIGAYGVVRYCTLRDEAKLRIFNTLDVNVPVLCVKAMSKNKLVAVRQVEHVKNEITIQSSLNHSLITPLYGVMTDSWSICLLMECFQGGELFGLLSKYHTLPVSACKFYAAQVVLIFEHLHSLNIAYRDLKPENLLINTNGNIQLADFGFAKVLDGRTYTIVGTPDYMSPEQCTTGMGHDFGVDWWSLGILIFEMLVGYAPFEEDNDMMTYERIRFGKVKYPSHLDLYTKDLISRLLVKDKSLRYGCLANGSGDLKRHKFFRGVDWTAVLTGRYNAPWKPEINEGELVSRYFERYNSSSCSMDETEVDGSTFDWLQSW